jgi:class 3 adenylate cyclase/predicted ATPase
MFIDLVGSTALTARLDPEDMGRVIRAYQDTCTEVVERWGGHVAKFMGDGVLAYFGWPQAHEDDAERAVRAGLELAGEVSRLTTPDGVPLGARVGIATGLVMVGDLAGDGAAQEQRVVGETPNLAARLQDLAEPQAVVIAEGTRRLLGGLFDYVDLGSLQLKGFTAPVRAWRVEGESRAEGRFEALHGQHLTPLVGRAHELGILLERWAWAKDGDGQVVLLSGEPGIGKSRVVRTLRERLGDEPHTALSNYCSPHHINSALHPVIDLLERAVQFNRDDSPEERLAKLEAMLGRSSDRLNEVVPLLAALLGVPTGERYPALSLPPEVQKRRTLQALVDQLVGLAARQPVLALYDDVHWIDPSTLELLGLVIERIRRLPVLVLLTFRPEFQPPWTGQAHVTTLTMSRLGRRQGADLVARVTGDKPLPAEVVEQIVARTDGVPLFVEELTKTVLESGLLRDAGDHYELAGPLPPLAIPATLHDSLMARLDRLAPVKEVAQIGAVIGREFSHELLGAVSPLSADKLGDALDQLVNSELVFRRGVPPEATYTFKHALVQDAAYQSLLKSKRQELHARIARVLAQHFPDTAAEILAYHLSEGGLNEQAAKSWYVASQNAGDRSAYREAVTHLQRGLEAVRRGGNEPWCIRREIELQNALGVALVAARGFVSEVAEAHARARELCGKVDEPAQLSLAIYGIWIFNMRRANLDMADQLSRELLAAAESEQRSSLVLQAHHTMWTTARQRGELDTAWQHAQTGLRLYRCDEHHHLAKRYGHDAGVCCRYTSAVVSWLRGFPDKAVTLSHEGLELGRDLKHPFTETLALDYVTLVYAFRREFTFAEEQLGNLMQISAEHRFPIRTVYQSLHEASILLARGDAEHAIVQAESGLAAAGAIGVRMRRPYFLAVLADAYLKTGRHEEGLKTMDDALDIVEQSGERWWQAELHRLRGHFRLAERRRDVADAEECFRRALAVSREQAARSLELRAATSLARLWAERGRRAEACDLLAPVYGWFTEGFDTADLKDAKALLGALA